MYAQVVYENSTLRPHITPILNQYVSERFATRPNEVLIGDTNENVGLGISADQKITLISSDVKNAMLEAERRKAEALNMLRFRETLR
jgi:ABC-type lipoprotein release transport system permease subunit